MDVLGKLTDAASMFWSALDERERRLVLYAAAYVIFTAWAAWQHGSRERLKRELREEIAAHAAAR